MSHLTLLNSCPDNAKFMVKKGADFEGAFTAQAGGGQAQVPTTHSYSVTASYTDEKGNVYITGPVQFTDSSRDVLAQVLETSGMYTFELVDSTGSTPNQITCANTCRYTVYFSVTIDGTPMKTVEVVNAHNNGAVDTTEHYTINAIENGGTTMPVSTSNISAVIEAYKDENDEYASVRVVG